MPQPVPCKGRLHSGGDGGLVENIFKKNSLALPVSADQLALPVGADQRASDGFGRTRSII